MSERPSHFTLRELHRQLANPVTLVVLLGVGAVLGLSGPFNTSDHLSLLARFTYWTLTTAVGYAIGNAVSLWLSPRTRDLPLLVSSGLMALATGGLISGFILGLNALVFGWIPDPSEAVTFFGTIFGISWVVTAVLSYVSVYLSLQHPTPDTTDAHDLPPILDRLPFDKRGALVSLTVEDHYVRIRTVNGEGMVLLRLSDAIREAGQTPGAQVHRSHWVAFDQVASVQRKGDRAILTLKTGAEIPASRSNIPKLKEAGLLP